MSLFAFFSRWKRRRSARQITMYTRAGCHLCEEAWALLLRYRQRYGFQLYAIDVDKDASLAALHGDWVPVVEIDGKVRFRGGINEVLLKRVLEHG
jgi:glutaredoxin